MSVAPVDVVLTAYNESEAAIRRTLEAVGAQTRRPASIRLVDDASTAPVGPLDGLPAGATVLRMRSNGGIAAARNFGIAAGSAPFVACLNIEVLPDPSYLEACLQYAADNPRVGLVCVRVDVADPASAEGRWRGLVQERPYPVGSGPVDWAAGHAMFIRRAAFEAVGGFNAALRLAGEDVDLCFRLAAAGHEVHFVSTTRCRSIQEDTPSVLARAEYNRACVRSSQPEPFLRSATILSSRSVQRLAIFAARRQFALIPIEARVYVAALQVAWRRRRR